MPEADTRQQIIQKPDVCASIKLEATRYEIERENRAHAGLHFMVIMIYWCYIFLLKIYLGLQINIAFDSSTEFWSICA